LCGHFHKIRVIDHPALEKTWFFKKGSDPPTCTTGSPAGGQEAGKDPDY